MYLLEDGTSLTSEIKEAFKRGLTRAYIKLGDTIIDPDNYLQNAKYKDEKADPETGQFIGVTSMRELTIKLYNYENSFNLENQEVEYYVGALVGNEYKYINFGNFIVQKPENQEVNEETTFTALDYMSKFDGDDEYVPQITFPTTLLGLTQDVCRQADVDLGNTDFRNASMQILANPFVNGENCRTVLKSIAKLAFSPAYIGQDNKLYIGFNIADTITETITTDDFFESKPNDEVKPITKLTLRSSEVKASGQSIPASQEEIEEYGLEELIEEYGINELIIEEDYLAYTDTLRNAYLTGATALFGLTYKPLTIDLLGSIYLSFNDVIKVINPQGEEYITYALNNSHEYNGTLYNTISVPSLSETEEKYKYEKEDDTYKRKTAIEIDKANGRIDLIANEVIGEESTLAKLSVEVGRIDAEISSVAKLTKPGETNTAHISSEQLTEIRMSEPLNIKIHPIIQNISYLYPSTGLFPSDSTYLKRRTLRFYNVKTDKTFDYELPCDLYYYDSEHYDEFLLDYGDGETSTCLVNKKVGINADGTTYLLSQQETISYPYPHINLTNGDYNVSILGYEAGYIYVLLLTSDNYSNQFATKIEMSSAINQSATDISLSVDYKLESYATTESVSASLELKIDKDDNDQIVSMINASADVIRLTAGRLLITSGNFKLDNSGNITCSGGTIGNINISDSGLYYSGSNSNEGFGLWKNGLHAYNNSYIIFHAGGNNANIGGASFKILENGAIESSNATITGGSLAVSDNGLGNYEGKVRVTGSAYNNGIYSNGLVIRRKESSPYNVSKNSIFLQLYNEHPNFVLTDTNTTTLTVNNSRFDYMSDYASGFSCDRNGNMSVSGTIIQGSLEKNKKNFEKFNNKDAIQIILNTDIYQYNFKNENDNIKKHIGFVIGEKFNYSKSITSEDEYGNEVGVDTYAMTSVSFGAIQELYKIVQELHQEIQELKERIK